MYRIMTPGPTEVSDSVLKARSLPCTNPDLDESFVAFYKETCDLISELLHTKNETLILGGEGILGLEAACASMTEPGDRVLVLDNGIYGAGFAGFVTMYGGVPETLSFDYHDEIDVEKLAAFLKNNHDFKYATLVHGDTPSSVKNPIEKICPLLHQYGILSVVDAVSSAFGEAIDVEACEIDILCGGSQKAVSAPPGLTFVTISEKAKDVIYHRQQPIASFYANLAVFKTYYEDKWFPYTMPISDIYGLHQAMIEIQNKPTMVADHAKLANAVRTAFTQAGYGLFLKGGYSNTVTAFLVPAGTTAEAILGTMRNEHNILLAGSLAELSGKVIRIGHMGHNATKDNMVMVLDALDQTFATLGVKTDASLKDIFLNTYEG